MRLIPTLSASRDQLRATWLTPPFDLALAAPAVPYPMTFSLAGTRPVLRSASWTRPLLRSTSTTRPLLKSFTGTREDG